MASDKCKVVCRDGVEFEMTHEVARGSRWLRSLLDDPADHSEEGAAFPCMFDSTLVAKVVYYLEQNLAEPIERLQRPLRSTDLKETGAPDWAIRFILSQPMDASILDLMETATFFQIHMCVACVACDSIVVFFLACRAVFFFS